MMNDVDRLRIQVIEMEARFSRLEERMGNLTIEVMKGRTEISEKVDALAEVFTATAAQVSALVKMMDELPAIITAQIAELLKKS